MLYVKLFEAYSTEDYQKALFKVKDFIKNNKPNDEILSFINTYASDDAKKLDSLRIMLDRIAKEYLKFQHYVFYNRKVTFKKKRSGEIERIEKSDNLQFYMISKEYQSAMDNFLSLQETAYKNITSHLTDIDLTLIEFLFNRLFEILHWVNKTGQEKLDVNTGQYHNNMDENQVISKLNSFNDFDFENEVEEVKKLVRLGKIQLKKAINLI